MLKAVFAVALAIAAVALAERASAEDYRWLQFGPEGLEARTIVSGQSCPAVTIDGKAAAMALRAAPDRAYPIRVCSLPVPAGATSVIVAGVALALPLAEPKRILVIGDTGCRLKGKTAQACNDPVAWPFQRNAATGAAMKPDLVIHVGDYHYRETACPAGDAGCAGSPFGDNWAVWQADFFSPAEPLLAAAPWVFVRGNHEICSRGGKGWAHALDPRPYDQAAGCLGQAPPYHVRIGSLDLIVMDDSSADEGAPDMDMAAAFKPQFEALAQVPENSWLLMHRPIWAVVKVKKGELVGGNATLAAATGGTMSSNVSLMLSGHIHAFEAITYEGGLPPQLVVGEGGDWPDRDTPADLAGLSVFNARIKSGVTLSAIFGFAMLEKSAAGWSATSYDTQGKALKHCIIAERAIACE